MTLMAQYTGKQILSLIRGHDFAHPGETEAIDLIFSYFHDKRFNRILDVGCGLGQTASYIQEITSAKLTAFDIDAEAIKHAQKNYPNVGFHQSSIENFKQLKLKFKFDLAVIISAFYAFSDQITALQDIRSVCQYGAKLAIFEYSLKTKTLHNPDLDLIYQKVTPAHYIDLTDPDLLKHNFNRAGWQISDIIDVSAEHIVWYRNFIAGIEAKKSAIIEQFGEFYFAETISLYQAIYNAMVENALGGVIVYAEARG